MIGEYFYNLKFPFKENEQYFENGLKKASSRKMIYIYLGIFKNPRYGAVKIGKKGSRAVN